MDAKTKTLLGVGAGLGALFLWSRRSSAAAAPEAYSEATSARRVTSTPTVSGTSRSRADPQVALAQELLVSLGYDPGPVDGRLGTLTRNALNDWQRDNGLPVTSTISLRTIEQLSAAASTTAPRGGTSGRPSSATTSTGAWRPAETWQTSSDTAGLDGRRGGWDRF